jgi:hypothetical protein
LVGTNGPNRKIFGTYQEETKRRTRVGLIAHVDTKRVPVEVVMDVPTPDRTRTWGAIGHGQLIDTLKEAVGNTDLAIRREEYSLSKDGGKMFGVFTLESDNTEKSRMLGFRNSVDKSLAVGLTAGARVTVCDNMVFSGEFIDYHVHRAKLTVEVLQLAAKVAIESMVVKMVEFETWHDDLNKYNLKRTDAEALTFRAVEGGVLSPGKFGKFHELFFEKKNEENDAYYDDTLYGFHGAMTQLWNNNSLIGTAPRHEGLVKLLNGAVDTLRRDGEIRN